MYVLCFVSRVGVGNWFLEGFGFWPLFHPVRRPFFLQALWKGLVVAAHWVVMDTLCVQLGLIWGLTSFLGTIPQAYLLLLNFTAFNTGLWEVGGALPPIFREATPALGLH